LCQTSARYVGFKGRIPYRGSQGPLRLLIDSTGIKAPSRQHPADLPGNGGRR